VDATGSALSKYARQAARLREAGLGSAAERVARSWAQLARRAGQAEEALRAANFLVSLALERLEPRLAARYGEEAVGLTVGGGRASAAERARLHLQLAKACWRLGRFREAEAYVDAARVCGQEAELPPRLQGHAALVWGLLAAEEGRLAEAETLTRQALVLAAGCGDHVLRAAGQNNLGWLARRRGDLDAAEAYLLPLAQGQELAPGPVCVDLAGIALERGEPDEALRWAEAAVQAFRLRPARLDVLDLAPLYTLFGRLAAATGRPGRARRLLGWAGRWFEATGRPARAAEVRAEAARCRGADRAGGGDGVLDYLIELVEHAVLYGERRAPHHHLRRVALLAQTFAPGGGHAGALEHAALLHELPAEGRWFCGLCGDGRLAEEILTGARAEDHALLCALDRYETETATGIGGDWRRPLEGLVGQLEPLARPAAYRLAAACLEGSG
jgi:tetratricopeptide (TPR) repeat protein